jgi:hypothetical protein
MTKWTFHNWTDCGPAQRVVSTDHAIELLMEHTARSSYGIYVGYVHDERGGNFLFGKRQVFVAQFLSIL